MRVLMTTDTVGGVWHYSLELVGGLARSGVEVHLATMGPPLTGEQRRQVGRVQGLVLHESTYRLEWMVGAWDDVALAGDWLLQVERDTLPDVVHLGGYTHGALCWRAPALVVGHSCVLSWWEAVRGEHAPAEWDRYRHEVGRGIRAADAVVAPTKAMLAALERHYGVLPDSRVIHNGRDGGLFGPGPKGHYVMAVGRLWDDAKNVGALGRIAGQLLWPVRVAGETMHPDGGETRLLGVELLGLLGEGDIAEALGGAAIYALPARYEPFGLSVLEAGLSGCALVLGDIPSLRELWDGAALFVSPGDDGALREAIQLLIEVDSLRVRLGEAARARAAVFSVDKMVRGYLSLYGEMTGAAPAGFGAGAGTALAGYERGG